MGSVYVCLHTDLWFCVCFFPYPVWESDLLSQILDCLFSHCFSGKSVIVVLPMVLGCWVCNLFFGLTLSFFGHARAKKNSKFPFLVGTVFTIFGLSPRFLWFSSQSCELIIYCGYAVVGLWTVWSGIEGWVCLRNLVFGIHTDRFIWLAFFSTTPEENWKGSQGLRDFEVEKGLIPGVRCVWVS